MMELNTLGSNQTEVIFNDNTVVFFSYKTPVAAWVNGKFYRTSKKWSVTTSRHINKWLDDAEAVEKDQEFFDNLGDT